MLPIIRRITRYGVLSIEWVSSQWRLGCIVHLPARNKERFVRIYDGNILKGLYYLEKLAADTYKQLEEEAKAPKQQEFNYGSLNKDWKEIS